MILWIRVLWYCGVQSNRPFEIPASVDKQSNSKDFHLKHIAGVTVAQEAFVMINSSLIGIRPYFVKTMGWVFKGPLLLLFLGFPAVVAVASEVLPPYEVHDDGYYEIPLTHPYMIRPSWRGISRGVAPLP